MTRGNDFNGKHDGWEFSGLNIVWILYYIKRNFLDWSSPGRAFLGGNCPGGSYPGWGFFGWELSRVRIFRVGGILGGNFPGGNFPSTFYGVLIPKLLNKPLASCSFTNLDFLIPQTEHFDCIISLLSFVLKIFEFRFSVFFSTLHARS